jgi:aminotransferase
LFDAPCSAFEEQFNMHRFASAKMASIKESGIRRILVKAWEMQAAGRDIIDFSIGRPDFDTPLPIKAAAIKALNAGQVHYTHSLGIIELRQAIAHDARQRLGLDVDPEHDVIVTCGGTGAMMITVLSVFDPGDEVIVPEPMYLFYMDWPEYAGARTVPLPLHPGSSFYFSLQDFEAKITPKTKAILINSPHNPTGQGLDREQLAIVAEVARRHDLLIISDEVYDHFVYAPFVHRSVASEPGMAKRTVIINSFSKTYAMDGWRIGYLIGPGDLIHEIEKTQQHTLLNAPTFGQWAAVEALARGPELVEPMLTEYTARRRLMLDLIADSPWLSCEAPQGAFYVWVKIASPVTDDWVLADRILDVAGLAMTPGEVFGPSGRGFFRLSFCLSRENIEKGLGRLNRALAELA